VWQSTTLCSPPSSSPRAPTASTNRYDLRKLKGHGLPERDGSRYAYRLTAKSVQVALFFLFFLKPPITAPTRQSNKSSNSLPQLNSAASKSRSRLLHDPCAKNLTP
jgi:hypothetical protein